jgi:protein gp37
MEQFNSGKQNMSTAKTELARYDAACKPKAGLRNNPANVPTLAEAGIDKNLAHEGRKLGALSEVEFEQKVAEARDATTRAIRTIVKSIVIDHGAAAEQSADGKEFITLETFDGKNFGSIQYPKRQGPSHFNRQQNDQISWTWFSWNVLTGCLHDCDWGCYARSASLTNPNLKKFYPAGFTPTFHHERLDAPANTPVPPEAKNNPWANCVFVGSMGDSFGNWVQHRWIEQVFASCCANPQWQYQFLTKFPQRYLELVSILPPTSWLGSTIDRQYRVKIVETAFAKLRQKGYRGILWVSVEPMMEPIKFTRLDLIDWVVIGALTATLQPEGPKSAFAPRIEWILDLVTQARAAGCRIYMKENLLGIPNDQCPGMKLIQEHPLAKQKTSPACDGEDADRIDRFVQRRQYDEEGAE